MFVIFFAGEQARAKIMKICNAFGANKYPFPEEAQKQRQMRNEVRPPLRLPTPLPHSSLPACMQPSKNGIKLSVC